MLLIAALSNRQLPKLSVVQKFVEIEYNNAVSCLETTLVYK